MGRSRKRDTERNVVDKHKLKIMNEYKKMQRKDEKSKSNSKTWKNNKAQFDEEKIENPMSVAYNKGQKVKQQKEQRHLEREEQEKIREEKLKQRRKIHKKLTAKTPKGQPLMRNQIEFLLGKIKSNKDLYCPKSKDT